MFKHYECKPIVWHQKPLVFDWDIDTGKIKGADAEKINQMADGGGIIAHPIPWSWEFSKEPLKNKTDMAAIIGYEHQLPDDLIDFYPKQDESEVFDPNVIY
jgi:hypothetical protein